MRRSTNAHDELVRVIRSVRRRWRWRVALRGAAIVLGAGLALFLISALGMDSFRFTPTAVVAGRVIAYGGLIALTIRYLIWPVARRVSDERVALYLEEHEPSLQAQLLSAVELDRTDGVDGSQYSPAMVRRLVEDAAEACADIEYGRRVERAPLARSSGLLAGGSLAALAILVLAPPFVRHSTPYLFPLSGTAAENPYSIVVSPGDARVAKGGELSITATLSNFEAEEVGLAVQRTEGEAWRRIPMTLDEASGDYLVILFDLEEPASYYVEASGVRSAVFRIDVAELPYVQQLALEYHFPSYTGLPVQRQEEGGDIAALKGTDVKLEVTPTIPVASGAIVLEEGDSLQLIPDQDGKLTGGLTVVRNGLYKIVFETLDGDLVTGSPDYLIDVLSDQPPFISFSEPGRDTRVTSIDEVFVEVEARDDYGIRSIELVYSVNGGAEETVGLYGGRGRRRELSAGHTFYLEEIELVPGDFISYYARASDANAVSGRQLTTTDIYFMEVRPFDREFRQAEASGGGSGGAGGFDTSLSRRQRDIVAATFKMVRDRSEYSEKEFNENLATLALAQGRVREQVAELLGRMRARGILGMDSSFAVIAEALPLAVSAMQEAEERLGERQPDEALSPEQRALQHLQRAESAFREVQVSLGEAQGGGGSQLDAEELAELFELELDKQRNQYERVQRDRQQRVNDEVDEAMQKLQELARRQQQSNERLRARQAEAGSGSGGDAQRQLAEEAEELARRLERLSREESRPELRETARRLRSAAEAMRRASARSRDGGLGEGISALDELSEARRALEQSRSAGLQRDIEDALRRAQRLVEDQRDVTEDVGRLEDSADGRRERLRRILERKEAMAEEVAGLEAQLDRLASDARSEQRDASRRLSDAANSIRDDKLEDKIRYSRGVVQQRSGEYARNFEEQIAGDLEALRDRIEAARDAVGEPRERRLARSLDRARDLTRSLESLRERIAESAQGSERGGEPGNRGGEPQRREARATDPQEGPTADGFPGLSPEETRQFQRELRERRQDMEELRRELEGEGIEAGELERIAARLRELERQRTFGAPRGLEELQAAVIQGLKEFEFGLRRQMGLGIDRDLLLTGSDEVPAGYRELVEEYYRALAGERDSRQ